MNLFAFIGMYLFFMTPTYFLRFAAFGLIWEETETNQVENPFDSANITLTNQAEDIVNAVNITLAICLALLVIIALFRGRHIGKPWLIVFPIVAFVFDFLFVFVPLVPTVMHVLTLVLGSIEDQKGVQKS